MNIKFIKPEEIATFEYYSLSNADLKDEVWREIDKNKEYLVSNYGRVKSLKKSRERILKPRFIGDYLLVGLLSEGKVKQLLVHRLVAEAFSPNPDAKPQVNHINGIKTDNRVDNLEWVTQSENQLHAYRTGLQGCGENAYQSILTNEQVEWARSVFIPHDTLWGSKALSKKLGVSQSTLHEALVGHTFKNVDGSIHVPYSKKKTPEIIRQEIKRLYKPYDRENGVRALARKFKLDRNTIAKIIKSAD